MDPDEVVRAQFRAYRVAVGYVRFDWLAGAEVTGSDARESLQVFASLISGSSTPLLIDTRGTRSLSREARKVFASATLASRVALFVESPVSRMIANFYIGMSSPSVPVKMFTGLDNAQRWLLDDQ